jgi:hypothetical protein
LARKDIQPFVVPIIVEKAFAARRWQNTEKHIGGCDCCIWPLITLYGTADPIVVGESTTYVLEISCGSGQFYLFSVCNIMPDSMQFLHAEGPTPFHVNKQEVSFAVLPTVSPGQKLVYKVICVALRPGEAVYQGVVTYHPRHSRCGVVKQECTTVLEKSK